MQFFRRRDLTAEIQARLEGYDRSVRELTGPDYRHPVRMRDWELGRILESLEALPPDARILDVGSYNTFLAAYLARRHRTVVASDLLVRRCAKSLLRRLRLAPAKPTEAFFPTWAGIVRRSGARLRNLDATRLDCPDGSFDAVIALSVIEHIPPVDRAVAELYRVLAPGGRLLITTDCSPEPTPYHDGVRYFSPEELARLFKPYPVTSPAGRPDFARENWCYNLGRPVVTAFIEITRGRN